MTVIGLTIILLILCFLVYILQGLDPISPALLFCGGFAACLVATSIFSRMWNYEMSSTVFVVVLGGCLLFVVSSAICRRIALKSVDELDVRDYRLPVNNAYLITLAVFVLVVTLVSMKLIMQAYPSDSLGGSIARYNSVIKFTDDGANVFPPLWDKFRNLASMAGYLFAFYLAQSFVEQDKPAIVLSFFGTTVACLFQVLSASRTMAVGYIFSFVVAYVMLRRHRDGRLPEIRVKTMLLIVAAVLLFLVSFQFVARTFQGRNTSSDPLVYISAYIGAEIPNLDTFIQAGGANTNPAIWGYMTFRNTIRWIGSQFGFSSFIYQYDLPFNVINGVSTGNVYTTFYAFIYDFGYIGFIFLTMLMAAFSQMVYSKSCKLNSGWASSIWVIVYSIIAYALLLSFFSNKFYENVFVITFVYKLVYLLILYIPVLVLSRFSLSINEKKRARLERSA